MRRLRCEERIGEKMLKNPDIIEKLNPETKASLIADGNALFTQGYVKAGIPRVAVSSADEVNESEGNLYPSFNALANSWNSDLMSAVAEDLAVRTKSEVQLLKTPPLRVKSNPYTEGISEDPYLVRTYAYNILKSIREAGVMPCLSGIALNDGDFRYLDARMDFGAVRDYFLSPYKALSALDEGVVCLTNRSKPEGSYAEVNSGALSNMLTVISEKRGGYVLCEGVDGDSTVKSAVKYTLALGGNASAITRAVANYDYIKESINTGDASGNDLDSACRDYTALSASAVDELCDKVISFALDCNKSAVKGTPDDNLALTASQESIVLLKNEGSALPLKKKCKIAITGEPAFLEYGGQSFAEYIASEGSFEITGTARGYSSSEERSEKLLNEARLAVKGADAVIVFVGLNAEDGARKSVKLPANRIALIDAMKRLGKKVIAVIAEEGCVDTAFDTSVSALLVAPLGGKRANEALSGVLRGTVCPSGRLAETYYDGTDGYFGAIRSQLKAGKRKAGGFIGYRYYDTSGEKVKYPFGFGLSYTSFTYSNLNVSGNSAEVTVKNTGKCEGAETVQLYIGKNSSCAVRPVKELKGFAKVFLKPGESKVVKFNINPKLLSVYDTQTGRNTVENGEYALYIASSASNVRLTAKMQVKGETLSDDGKKIKDYIPDRTDILSGGYMLGDVKLAKVRGKGAIASGIIAMITALLGVGVLFALHYLAVIDIKEHLYLQIIFYVLSGLFGLNLIIMFIGVGLYRKSKKRAVTVRAKRKSAPVPAHPFEKLFEKEFKAEEEIITVKEETREAFDEEQEALRHIDPSFTLNTACSQLVAYCLSRGINIDAQSAAKVLASFVSSRLVIIKSKNARLLPEFLSALNGYFGTEEFIESFSGCNSFEDFTAKTSRAVLSAKNARKDVHVASLTDVNADNIRDILLPMLKYAVSPEIPCSVKYGYDSQFEITPNVWFVLALAEGAAVSGDDVIILNSSVAVDVNISECGAGEECEVRHISYYQLDRFASEIANKYPVDENRRWKRVDKFEKYVNAHTPYHIGNKSWLRAERFASSMLACGSGQPEALDTMVASVLLPSAVCLLNGKISPDEDGLSDVLERIFGEDGAQECKEVLNSHGLIN